MFNIVFIFIITTAVIILIITTGMQSRWFSPLTIAFV